jgi:hypothetical protein
MNYVARIESLLRDLGYDPPTCGEPMDYAMDKLIYALVDLHHILIGKADDSWFVPVEIDRD